MNQEQSINELKKQLDLSKNKSSKLEADLKLLEDNKQSLATDSEQQLYTLQKVITLVLHIIFTAQMTLQSCAHIFHLELQFLVFCLLIKCYVLFRVLKRLRKRNKILNLNISKN